MRARRAFVVRQEEPNDACGISTLSWAGEASAPFGIIVQLWPIGNVLVPMTKMVSALISVSPPKPPPPGIE